MVNPQVENMAYMIADRMRDLLIDRQLNVLTLQDHQGHQYMVMIESVFIPTNANTLEDDVNPIPE